MKSNHGQILPLAVVMILMMALLWVMVINIGMLIRSRIQLQIAADTSVQSACAIRARALSSIGRMNSWLGTPVFGIGWPDASWWPFLAPLQAEFVTAVTTLQTAYNKAYGGGWAARLVRNNIAKPQGADDIYTPAGSYSLKLQRNKGDITYWGTCVGPYGIPFPCDQEIEERDVNRWYEQGPGFYKKAMRLYTYRRASSALNGPFPWGQHWLHIKMPDLYAVAAARLYNAQGPMFPTPLQGLTGDFLNDFFREEMAGEAAKDAYTAATPHWQSQLVPVGVGYEH